MKYFFAILLAAMLLPHPAKADFIPDNQHIIDNCIGVENITEYPEYDFVWAVTGWRNISSSQKIATGEQACHVAGTYELFAIKKTDWNKVRYEKDDQTNENGNPAEQWIQDSRNSMLFITSNYTTDLSPLVPDTNSAVKQLIAVHIDSVSSAGVVAHTASTLTLDKDNAETSPKAEDNTMGTLSTTAILLIGIGILGLGAAGYAWKKK